MALFIGSFLKRVPCQVSLFVIDQPHIGMISHLYLDAKEDWYVCNSQLLMRNACNDIWRNTERIFKRESHLSSRSTLT